MAGKTTKEQQIHQRDSLGLCQQIARIILVKGSLENEST